MIHPVYPVTSVTADWIAPMSFHERLAATRHARKLSQAQLSRATGINQGQIKRYELGQTLPNLTALRKLAQALNVSLDMLVFDEGERGPPSHLTLQFEAVKQLPETDQAVIREVLESLIIRYQSRRWDALREAPTRAA